MDFFGNISITTWLLALFGAFSLGFSKTGFPGLAMVNVLILAELFGAKASVGMIVPMLIVCDLTVYPLFRRYSSWKEVWPLLPPTFVGLIAGYFLLDYITESTARKGIGAIIMLMLGLQLGRLRLGEALGRLTHSAGFRWISGFLIGSSTIMANAAGPVFSIYALVEKMAKETFLGVGARCFLLVNIIKLPMVANLELVNEQSLRVNLLVFPAIFAGIFIGRKAIQIIPQQGFEILLYIFSAIAGIRLFFF
ncbi:MAG: sulfite exporter TauE/SafE family protein [Verrucomicrobiota bacterium]|nr:sulfite exporter TauE/SafE family protein [Verrucomicrobiota bacterium]